MNIRYKCYTKKLLEQHREKLKREIRSIEGKARINRVTSKSFKINDIKDEILLIGEILKELKNE